MNLTLLRLDPVYATASLAINTLVVGKCGFIRSVNTFIQVLSSGVIPILLLTFLNYKIIKTMKEHTMVHNKMCKAER